MTEYLDQEKKLKLRGCLLEDVQLVQYTSWRTGGLAQCLYQPADIVDLSLFFSAISDDMPIFWLGHGTNLLVRDQGVEGVVILVRKTLDDLVTLEKEGYVYAEAGATCAQLAYFTVNLNLTGLEFLVGIPGTVGGALAMNAGADGGQIWDSVTCVKTIDRNGVVRIREKNEYQVNYRRVIFPAKEWFVGGYFRLCLGEKEQSLRNIAEMLSRRQMSQPLHLPNAGSVFRNPDNDYAARLIERCGLKGMRIGGACVSEKHANFIVNDGQASASDIEKLIEYITRVVKQKTGIQLEKEIHIWG
jgi:UDP-N-acetylmuramate dehydrogenase